jgi:hypothetical protein
MERCKEGQMEKWVEERTESWLEGWMEIWMERWIGGMDLRYGLETWTEGMD